jgi:hypothetical protein
MPVLHEGLSTSEMKTLFRNVEELYALHKDMTKQLDKEMKKKQKDVSFILLEFANSMHGPYQVSFCCCCAFCNACCFLCCRLIFGATRKLWSCLLPRCGARRFVSLFGTAPSPSRTAALCLSRTTSCSPCSARLAIWPSRSSSTWPPPRMTRQSSSPRRQPHDSRRCVRCFLFVVENT